MADETPWPPATPDDEFRLVGDPEMRLLGDLEDLEEWSDDVVCALLVLRADIREWRHLVDAHPDVREQLDAGDYVTIAHVARFLTRNPQATRQELRDLSRAALAAGKRAMRFIARRQQQRRMAEMSRRPLTSGRPPRTHLALRSVIDNWRWRPGGRPPHCHVTGLLLRVEVWRDVRAQVLPAEGIEEEGLRLNFSEVVRVIVQRSGFPIRAEELHENCERLAAGKRFPPGYLRARCRRHSELWPPKQAWIAKGARRAVRRIRT